MIQAREETKSGWQVIVVSGRADADSADDLEQALKSAVAAHAKVAADFSALDYISSAGIRAVLQAARAAQTRTSEFVVCGMSPAVKKVFDMSGLHHILKIHGELPC